MSRPSAALLVALFTVSLVFLPASAQPQANSVTMEVHGDGTTAVTQVVSVNATDTSTSLQLLSSTIADPVVFDQNGSSLYFQVTGSNITIYDVGATEVTLEYATTALTSEQGALWTLEFTAYQNTTVVLPQQSTLTSVSGTPNQLSTADGSPVVAVAPGTWEISYGVPIEVSATSSSESGSAATSTTSTANSGASSAGASQSYLIGAALAAIAIALAVATSWLVLRRGRSARSPKPAS